MEREIKFRGRTKDGRWLKGNLVQYADKAAIVSSDDVAKTPLDYVGAAIVKGIVLNDTIGELTCITDKNGKSIYEGDIVEAWSEGSKAIGVIKRRIDGLWLIYPAWQDNQFWFLIPNANGKGTVEIIGNIYDNPELIKE